MCFHVHSLPSSYYSPTASFKAAIPRLQQANYSQPSKDSKRRVQRACTACRTHKIKCTGDYPKCKHCETTSRECIYILPRKDRLKFVVERCVQLAGMLETMKACASDEDAARIAELLEAVEEDVSETRQAPLPSDQDINKDELRGSTSVVDSNVRKLRGGVSMNFLDLLDEDLHQKDQSRATGFVGQSSEVQSLRSFLLRERAEDTATKVMMPERYPWSTSVANSGRISNITFYLDSESIGPGSSANQYDPPSADMTGRLLNVYMKKVHDSFPILPRKLFESQVRTYFGEVGVKTQRRA